MKSSLGFTIRRKTKKGCSGRTEVYKSWAKHANKKPAEFVLLSLSRHTHQLEQLDVLKRCKTLRDFTDIETEHHSVPNTKFSSPANTNPFYKRMYQCHVPEAALFSTNLLPENSYTHTVTNSDPFLNAHPSTQTKSSTSWRDRDLLL